MGKSTAVLVAIGMIFPADFILAQTPALKAMDALCSRLKDHNNNKFPIACRLDNSAQIDNPTTFFKERQYCDLMAKYPLSPTAATFSSYDNNFCSPAWTKGKPWETPAGILFREKFNADYEPATRAQKLKDGFSVLSKQQRADFLKESRKTKEAAAIACCADDKKCLKHFKKIDITYCNDSEAEKFPNKSDKCARSPGQFSLEPGNTGDFSSYIIDMVDLATNSDISIMSPEEKEFFYKRAQRAIDEGGRRDLGAISSGGVLLSAYSYDGVPTTSTQNLAHELGHACSHIRRQMIILNLTDPVESAKAATDSLRYSFKTQGPVPNCPLMENKTIELYERITENLKGTNSKGLVACLADLAKKSADPKSAVYVKNSCERGKLEEGFAEAMGFLTDPDLSKEILLSRCLAYVSTYHPSTADVLTCLFQNSPSFLEKTKSLLNCAAPDVNATAN